MKSTARRLVKGVIDKAGFEIRPRALSTEELAGFPVSDRFVTADNDSLEVLAGFRDRVKPGWRGMFSDPQPVVSMSQAQAFRRDVHNAQTMLGIHGHSLAEKSILEIGCHSGGHAFSMVLAGAERVDAVDIVEYGVLQSRDGEVSDSRGEEQRRFFTELRRSSQARYESLGLQPEQARRVNFAELDVHELSRVDAYDAVVSWETLEHIRDPALAFANIYRALKPGGFCFHEYNPFFSFIGGHSLCTLDSPWGHVRVSDEDFSAYVQRFRPSEERVAVNFFTRSLNRMALADLTEIAATAGFETIEITPWPDRALMGVLSPELYASCKKRYPQLVPTDLLASFVWVLLHKPVA